MINLNSLLVSNNDRWNNINYSIVIMALVTSLFVSEIKAEETNLSGVLTGKELISQCAYKFAGKDQTSTFTVTLEDASGNKKKSIYRRYWKDYGGKGNVIEKMMLFTEFPPDSKGGAFMRTAFTPESGKSAEQWIYLPVLRKTRRVTIRDPGDRFLNSDLTYQDVSFRPLDDDQHFYKGMDDLGGESFYKVESTPRTKGGLYSKRLFWIDKGDDAAGWEQCVVKKIAYYDSKGVLLKEQLLDWQKVGDAWMWRRVVVTDLQERHKSTFEMSDVEVDSGLSDRQFSKRTLKSGIESRN